MLGESFPQDIRVMKERDVLEGPLEANMLAATVLSLSQKKYFILAVEMNGNSQIFYLFIMSSINLFCVKLIHDKTRIKVGIFHLKKLK